MRTKRIGRADLLLIAALMLAGLILTLLLFANRQDGREAVVRVDGQAVARLPLSEDRRFPVEIDGTVTNVLIVHNGVIRMEEANCPDHLCIHRGAIRYAGDSIVCLPNRVFAEITGNDALNLDAVTG